MKTRWAPLTPAARFIVTGAEPTRPPAGMIITGSLPQTEARAASAAGIPVVLPDSTKAAPSVCGSARRMVTSKLPPLTSYGFT